MPPPAPPTTRRSRPRALRPRTAPARRRSSTPAARSASTRQVLSLITNPMDVICRNIRTVREKMATRPDILGCHLEGPFLALKCKGAHEPNCLKDPVPELVDRMLDTSGADLAAGKLGCIRQITISTPPTGPPNTSGAPAARWSKLLPAKSTPVPPVFETTSYA
ncbi:N-acetylglucosamine-6-phosphate deacetylase NagA2 [Bifidobacterium bifidum]|nr:N-acetylglucosamine-6-phosphate deacetylase NagA2 [Bifidobacterium bifidum]